MIGPIGLAEPVRVILVKCGKMVLNPTTQIIVVQPSRVDNRESKATSMTRIVAVDVEDFPIGPLFRVFSFDDRLERTSTLLTPIARPGPNLSSDSERHPASLCRLQNTFSTPSFQSGRIPRHYLPPSMRGRNDCLTGAPSQTKTKTGR